MYVCVRVCVLVVCVCVCVCAEMEAPRCLSDGCTIYDTGLRGINTYSINGQDISILYKESEYIQLYCLEGVTLESPEYPRFPRLEAVLNVTLNECDVPSASLHAALLALNVSVEEALIIKDMAGDLSAHHFDKLQHLVLLEITGNDGHLQSDALQSLTALRTLYLKHLILTPSEINKFPLQIEHLKLDYVKLTEYDLNGFQSLTDVQISGKHSITLKAQNASSLSSLYINTLDLLFPSEWRPPSLRELVQFNWNSSEVWSACPSVETLLLHGSWKQRVRLPARWVAHCPRLTTLFVDAVVLDLHSEVFRGATSLQTLTLYNCHLQSLPKDLFKDTSQLTQLRIDNNELQSLPSGLFRNLVKLERLDLSRNLLTSEVASGLTRLVSLKVLDLSRNPSITDLCSDTTLFIDPGESSLKSLVDLQQLDLSDTSVTRVCSDWRTSMKHLALLKLTNTKITSLSYLDMQFVRSASSQVNEYTVDFSGANISKIYMKNKEHRKNVVQHLSSSKIQLHLTAHLPCDCHDYWMAMVFNETSAHQTSMELVCRDQELTLLDALKNNVLECSDPTLFEGESNCTCAYRPDEQLGVVATANCEHGALSEMPALKYSSTPHWRLLLANNHIRTVRAQELPSQLLELDLRNNSVERLGVGAGARLSATLLWLSGNEKLDCTCGGHELLGRAVVQDSAQARCSDGRALNSVPDPGACSSWLGVALAVLGVAAAAVAGAAAYCARPQTRLRVKVLLLRAGWLRRPPESDDGRRYDAFVSYAHEDGAVVEELARRLESELGYRLCLHYRDWGPGEWIHVQIAASVEASRRTLVVVSKHFLRSKWARQEFREAHAAALTDLTPRLLLLFLDPPQDLPLDAELRSYIKKNTYLLWNDSWFWSKLITAMPPPPPKPALSKQEQTV